MEKNNKIFILIFFILLLFILKNNLKNKTNSSKKEVGIVPPQFVYNALNDSDEKILLVNTLSDKEGMKYKITLNGDNNDNSLSKQQFEELLLKNNNKIPNNINRVVIYCASWSCNGAKNYYKELIKRKINVDKVVDYIGSIHEWASYSKIRPTVFTFHSTEDDSIITLNKINDIFKNTAHVYFIDNVLKDDFLLKNSIEGKSLFNNNFL